MNLVHEKLKCRQLSKQMALTNKQYIAIAQLIYETDPYIYPAMFGNGEIGLKNASVLLSHILRQGSDPMFNLDNIYAIEQTEEIMGIILWHKGKLTWNCSELQEFAKKFEVSLNEKHLEKVKQEYFKKQYYSDFVQENSLSIINMCVEQRARGHGVGSVLLEHFIKEYNPVDMKLCVLKENIAALNLYRKFGFVIEKKMEGFSISSDKPKCYEMVRIHELDLRREKYE